MSPLEIIPINPYQLHNYWTFLEHGLSYHVAEFKTDWYEPDVYAAIRNSQAEAFLISRDQRQIGFFVSHVELRPFSGLRSYFVWILWATPMEKREPGDGCKEDHRQVFEFIKMRAKELKCVGISLRSPRRGWERYGFRNYMVEYRLDF